MAHNRNSRRYHGLSGVCGYAALQAGTYKEDGTLSFKIGYARSSVQDLLTNPFERKGWLHTVGMGPKTATAIMADLDAAEPVEALGSITPIPTEWMKLARLGYWEYLYDRLQEIHLVNRRFEQLGIEPRAVVGTPDIDQLRIFDQPDPAA